MHILRFLLVTTTLALFGCPTPVPGDTAQQPPSPDVLVDDAGDVDDDAGATPDDAGATPTDAGPTLTDAGSTPTDAGTGGTLAERHPGDVGLASHPSVLFFDDFENGWGRWDAPQADTAHLFVEDDASRAASGDAYLRSTVTRQQLQETQYISSQTSVRHARVDEAYYRFYARFETVAPNPHHWVRFAAGDETYNSSGLANTVPPGDRGFWFDFDVNTNNLFNFYVYWHAMRSGRCNDGSTVEGCDGDQGNTYHYGNVFRPADQQPFERGAWFCIEIRAKANTVGDDDGALEYWIDDVPVGAYGPGYPVGTWLRDQFHEGGCDFFACDDPTPFSGFNFRTSDDVKLQRLVLDAYYERGSSENRRTQMENNGLVVDDAYTIFYDDVVVATERIGCRR